MRATPLFKYLASGVLWNVEPKHQRYVTHTVGEWGEWKRYSMKFLERGESKEIL